MRGGGVGSYVKGSRYLPTSGDLKSGLSILHYIPQPPNVNSTNTPTPPSPPPKNCLRTLHDVLHDVHGIKMHFHHCNDELIFVID